MTHLKKISISKAMAAETEKQDVAGAIFLQIWLTALGLILSKGFD